MPICDICQQPIDEENEAVYTVHATGTTCHLTCVQKEGDEDEEKDWEETTDD